MNPVIEYASPELDGIFLLDSIEGNAAWVGVYDPDEGDTVEYLWTITGLGPQATASATVSENYQISKITLLPRQIYHDRTLTVTVFDSRGASTRASWTIEVEEGLDL